MSELQPGITQKRAGQLRLPSRPGEGGAEWRAQRDECRRHGFRYSPRLHILLWGSKRGM